MRSLTRRRDGPEYWSTVHRLMDVGWYRVGRDPGAPEAHWCFRQGHIQETAAAPRRVIAAPDEATAMHLLLQELNQEPSDTY
jgi:hypothetical protein